MLNRNDLVNQFELVVKQEIIDHNKSILANNIAMQEIRDEITNLENQFNSKLNILSSELEKNRASIVDAYSVIETYNRSLVNSLSDIKQKFSKTEYDLRKEIEKLISRSESEEIFSRLKDFILEKLDNYHKESKNINFTFYQNVKELEKSFSECFETYRKELYDFTVTMDKSKKELINKIEESRVEKAGIEREIAILKKTMFINEKKIEHLNTLIERIGKNKS